MNLMKLDMKLPEVFYALEEKMKKLANGEFFSIAGGSLSNLYMGIPFRDIDIFFNFETDEKTMDKVREVFEIEPDAEFKWDPAAEYEGLGDGPTIPYLIRFTYQGYPVELIQCPKSKIYEFDLRFRQFYFYDGCVYTTKEALEDIKNKEIVVVNPSTPISTTFRMYRFQEQLGFTIRPESEFYTRWAFKHVTCKLKKAEEYLLKNKHKISDQLYHELLDWFSNNKVMRYVYDMKKEKNVEEFFIEDSDAVFPFHENIERVIGNQLNNWEASLAVNYEMIENYQPFEKKIMLKLSYEDMEESVKRLTKKLKKLRTRYLLSPNHIEFPFPLIKEDELKKRYKEYFNPNLLTSLANMSGESNYQLASYLEGLAASGISEKTIVKVKSMSNFYRHTLSDILANNVLEMKVGTKRGYYLRKCDNGKYTIAGFLHEAPDGSGFYQDIIGRKLKESEPDFFDYENENLKGIFRYSHTGMTYEYYFGSVSNQPNLIERKNMETQVPIQLEKEA